MTNQNMMKPLGLLLLTLFIGMALGAAITGRIVQSRLANYNNFFSDSGFAQTLMDAIEPESEAQREELLPILEETGRNIQETRENARTEILLHNRKLEAELSPLLSKEQANRLQSLREKLRNRLNEYRETENR